MSETPDLGKGPSEPSYQPATNPYQSYQPHSPYGGMSPTGVPWGPPPDHPQTTTVLVLGILGLVLCQVLSPFAWAMGRRVVREIDASGGRLGGRSTTNAGRICGIVGTAILGFYLALVALLIVIAIVAPEWYDEDDDYDGGYDDGYYGLAAAHVVPVS